MGIIDSTSKPEWLKAGGTVKQDNAELVVVFPCSNHACSYIDYQARAAQVVCNDAVGYSISDHIIRHVTLTSVDKATHHVVIVIKFGNQIDPVLVQKTLHQSAIDTLADAPIPS